jgi:hypothetical protein
MEGGWLSTQAKITKADHLLSTPAMTYSAFHQLRPRPTNTSTEDHLPSTPAKIWAVVDIRWRTWLKLM